MIIRSRMRKRMMRKKINPLSIGVSRHLLLKETEELELLSEANTGWQNAARREAKDSWQNVTQKALYDELDN